MENASKALIIAGAILLSILIISLGIMVYNNAKNTVGSANLNKQEIETFNSEWQAYEGTTKTASEVKTMVNAVIASNAAESKSKTNRWIKVTNTGTPYNQLPTQDPNVQSVSPSNARTFTISLGYSNGRVVGIDWIANN